MPPYSTRLAGPLVPTFESVPPTLAGGVTFALRFVGMGANSCQPIELPAEVPEESAGKGGEAVVAWWKSEYASEL